MLKYIKNIAVPYHNKNKNQGAFMISAIKLTCSTMRDTGNKNTVLMSEQVNNYAIFISSLNIPSEIQINYSITPDKLARKIIKSFTEVVRSHTYINDLNAIMRSVFESIEMDTSMPILRYPVLSISVLGFEPTKNAYKVFYWNLGSNQLLISQEGKTNQLFHNHQMNQYLELEKELKNKSKNRESYLNNILLLKKQIKVNNLPFLYNNYELIRKAQTGQVNISEKNFSLLLTNNNTLEQFHCLDLNTYEHLLTNIRKTATPEKWLQKLYQKVKTDQSLFAYADFGVVFSSYSIQ